MQIKCNTSTMRLEDMPLDIGYASEKVTLKTKSDADVILGGQNGKTQLIVTAPFIDDALMAELERLESALPEGEEVTATLITANDVIETPSFKRFDYLIDSADEFSDWYGVRLSGDPLDGELTKALFIISKDGALYYDQFAEDLYEPFNAETAIRKIHAARECYTGKGCH